MNEYDELDYNEYLFNKSVPISIFVNQQIDINNKDVNKDVNNKVASSIGYNIKDINKYVNKLVGGNSKKKNNISNVSNSNKQNEAGNKFVNKLVFNFSDFIK